MKRIGIISDTHAYWDEKYEFYLKDCDEIWHAGDIGSLEIANKFEAMKPTFRAVYGNCDGYDIRARYPEIQRFRCEDVDVLLKHIGGYPGRYDQSIRNTLYYSPPNLFVDGQLAYIKDNVRQNIKSATYKPRSSRLTRISQRENHCKTRY